MPGACSIWPIILHDEAQGSALSDECMDNYLEISMQPQKNIVLVAHDNKKQDLLEWTKFNRDLLAQHRLYATGTTGLLCGVQSGDRGFYDFLDLDDRRVSAPGAEL
jgi:hypothetical protein